LASALVTRRFIGAKGVQLAADVGGDPQAPTIVLLHGGGQTRHSWGGAMRQLVLRGYHVINLDARGHGDSQWAEDGDYTLEVLARDLECVIGTLRSRPALVGASMGGATALLVAGAHADPLAAALVLVDVVPRIDTAGAAKIRSFMSSGAAGFGTLEEASDAVAAYNPHRPRPRSNAGLMKNLRLRGDGRWYWHWDPRVLQQVRHAEPPLFADRLNSAAEKVRIPTLLVRGLQSDIVTEASVADFRGHLPQLEVFDVSGAGHMVAGDKNDAFNQGVFEFMQRHLPADAPAPGR
jgi:pimeloyl-ACP methyl ester carboxylesterase